MSTEDYTVEAQPQLRLPELVNVIKDDNKINLAKFDNQQRQRIVEIASTVGVLDSAAVTGFGVEVQQRMNSFLDQLLQGIRTYEVGASGELTIELAKNIKVMNLQKMKQESTGEDWVAGSFGKLPIVGQWFSAIRHFQLTHQEITKHLTEIEDKAQREMGKLAATNAKLDQLAERTLENLKDLELYLAAGQSVLMRARANFHDRKNEIMQSNDPIALTELRDAAEQINAFETRLLRMHIAFTDALTAIPQIRVNQEAARIEARNIMDTVLFDLPRLKSAIIRVASLNQIINASKANEARRELARQIGSIGAEALDEAYTRAKQSQGNGMEDVAVLAATADKLLETIAKGVQIDEENRQKRQMAERQLGDIKGKLLEGLRANARDVANRSV